MRLAYLSVMLATFFSLTAVAPATATRKGTWRRPTFTKVTKKPAAKKPVVKKPVVKKNKFVKKDKFAKKVFKYIKHKKHNPYMPKKHKKKPMPKPVEVPEPSTTVLFSLVTLGALRVARRRQA